MSFNTNWDGWTDDVKPYDRGRPFHRINSPNYDESDHRKPSGDGYGCGCRDPDRHYSLSPTEIVTSVLATIIASIVGVALTGVLNYARRQLLRALPSWVPVSREGKPPALWPVLPDPEKEVEGVLLRSFQTWTDVPIFQWHRWYDWNFHIRAAKGYEYIVGRGNPSFGAHEEGGTPLVQGAAIECEWDCGSFGDYDYGSPGGPIPSRSDPGPMFNNDVDWAWPMTGQHVWIAGRWIYDCGHDIRGKMKTELHPCKAVATARWEAFKFKEHEHYVPAIQFMFFACRRGGYVDGNLNERNYEFIVDLPALDEEIASYPIGHTPEFPMNTLVIRPRLLIDFDYTAFSNARQPAAQPGAADPQVELLPPSEPGRTLSQAKIRIPLQNLAADVESYGVIVSLGWHDPRRQQLNNVKKVVVHFRQIEFVELHEVGEPELVIKFGANGRWRAKFREDSRARTLSIDNRITMHLALDDTISVSSHGMEEEAVGDIIRYPTQEAHGAGAPTPSHPIRSIPILSPILDLLLNLPEHRTLVDSNDQQYSWAGDIDQRDNDHATGVAQALVENMWFTFEEQNEPLGIVDPFYRNYSADQENPLTVRRLIELAQPNNRLLCTQTAFVTEDKKIEDAEGNFKGEALIMKPGEVDYRLHYIIEYYDQQVP